MSALNMLERRAEICTTNPIDRGRRCIRKVEGIGGRGIEIAGSVNGKRIRRRGWTDGRVT